MNFYSFPAWSLSGSRRSGNQSARGIETDSPGPVYDTSEQGTHGPAWKIGLSKRSSMGTTATPLPGHYNIPDTSTGQPRYSIPHGSRKEDINENPGPSAYQTNYSLVKSKSSCYTMSYKYDSGLEDKRKLPGPGDYETTRKADIEHKKSIFGTSSRKSLGGDPSIPGPGQYEVRPKTQRNEGQSIGNAKRLTQNIMTPGPNAYELKSEIQNNLQKKKGYSLSVRTNNKPFETAIVSPGPSQYNIEAKKIYRSPSYSIGKFAPSEKKNEISPGPQDYNVKNSYHIPSGNMTKAAGHVGFEGGEETPGPAAYKTVQAHSHRYSIPRSKSMTNTNDNPGPGDYRTQAGVGDNNGKGPKIGKSLRLNFISKNAAGPGDYNITTSIGNKLKGITIPRDKKHGLPNENPGPGHYNHQTVVSNLSKYALYKPPSQQ